MVPVSVREGLRIRRGGAVHLRGRCRHPCHGGLRPAVPLSRAFLHCSASPCCPRAVPFPPYLRGALLEVGVGGALLQLRAAPRSPARLVPVVVVLTRQLDLVEHPLCHVGGQSLVLRRRGLPGGLEEGLNLVQGGLVALQKGAQVGHCAGRPLATRRRLHLGAVIRAARCQHGLRLDLGRPAPHASARERRVCDALQLLLRRLGPLSVCCVGCSTPLPCRHRVVRRITVPARCSLGFCV